MCAKAFGEHCIGMPYSDVPVKVFLADDSALIRERVAAMLAAPAMAIVGQAETPQGSHRRHPGRPARTSWCWTSSSKAARAWMSCAPSGRQSPDIAFVVFSNNSGPAYRKRYLGDGARALPRQDQPNSTSSSAAVERRVATHVALNPSSEEPPCPPPHSKPTVRRIRVVPGAATPRAGAVRAAQDPVLHLPPARPVPALRHDRQRDVDRLDSLMFARRKVQGRPDAVPRRRPLPVHLRGAHAAPSSPA